MTHEQVEALRAKYEGKIVELIEMEDPQAVPVGTTGLVNWIDDLGNIHVLWKNGSRLALIPDVDKFKLVGDE